MPKVVIKSQENGPNLVYVDSTVAAALCRCGQSANKPYCDGSHRRAEFKGKAAEVKVLE
jgi:CDGSH-type Zn-finger protein